MDGGIGRWLDGKVCRGMNEGMHGEFDGGLGRGMNGGMGWMVRWRDW